MPHRLTASKLSKELGGIARDISPRLQHVISGGFDISPIERFRSDEQRAHSIKLHKRLFVLTI
ncbi:MULTISPECIES: hypothetical protein [unclassified Bradyrhizobium]|uniref:hypothetical protein n=1 Tax=unclassified Bradyrhizobium TaxID=2631580 RepID=UPI002478AA82|nr:MULTISPECIES: hypothetical protein [unclassified Bradyrhizobium]WGR72773.1 hypothetical protein MTX24_07650 [Bradyrhizobium sp. ISRA426]WGR77608.1 hypothetical protein MTX21_32605 [Bradyrhizobium sp. ISRA430]WGR88013.1 hypothetical protein MTX25_07655 [Bradyrhizobium sp. ISRA432]